MMVWNPTGAGRVAAPKHGARQRKRRGDQDAGSSESGGFGRQCSMHIPGAVESLKSWALLKHGSVCSAIERQVIGES